MKDKKELIREIRNLEQRQHTLFKKYLCEDYRERFTYYGELFEAKDMIVYYKKLMLRIHEDNKYIFGGVDDLYFVENMEKYKKKPII